MARQEPNQDSQQHWPRATDNRSRRPDRQVTGPGNADRNERMPWSPTCRLA